MPREFAEGQAVTVGVAAMGQDGSGNAKILAIDTDGNLKTAAGFATADDQGWTQYTFDNLGTSVQTVKGTAAKIYLIQFVNTQSVSTAYLQLFDVASATTVTLGTTLPMFTLVGAVLNAQTFAFPNGVDFKLGIKIAATTLPNGSVAASAGNRTIIYYK